jgi:adenine-specific DNA-methyltransferase
MKKPVKSLSHKTAKRAHIPSGEEAGYEAGNARVQETPTPRTFPKNPIVHRGSDPELFWMNKYGADDASTRLSVDLRSLYRHEHIAPEALINGLYRVVATENKEQPDLGFSVNELFGNATTHEELDKVSDYYTHSDGWTNRLIQGDSLLAMTSLLEREGMAGQVQCCYFDPPYGIKYGSNWQIRLNNRTVTDGQDDSLSGEPEQIKAFRDTWELGIHSYLSYLRDRLLVARELLHDSGSCFVQISDENVHLVRCLMDEVFGSGNFCCLICFRKTTGANSPHAKVNVLATTNDFILWYAKDVEKLKYRQLYLQKSIAELKGYNRIESPDGSQTRALTAEEIASPSLIPLGWRIFQTENLTSAGHSESLSQPFEYQGKAYRVAQGNHWKTTQKGMRVLGAAGRLIARGNTLNYKRYFDDFQVFPMTHSWQDIAVGYAGDTKSYVVQTSSQVIQRCILMTTDPGDLVLDPTCGSGTTAYVAEQWGRRWITTDTSRIALNIAKTRLMTATFPFYNLYDTEEGERAVLEKKGQPGKHDALKDRDPKQPLRGHNVRYGFVYKKVPHITLGSIANNEPPAEETLYDQPLEDKKRLRVAGPFTVETLQSYEPISPEELTRQREQVEELAAFEDLIFEHLKSAGVKTGDKSEQAVFTRIDRLSSTALHAEGFYETKGGEKKAYLHIGPKFGTVSKQAVNEAIKACRGRHDADWLMILGFAFESGLADVTTKDFGSFKVSIVRMHDDLLQEGLLKKDKKAASFVTIGEPDIRLHRKNGHATVEIAGLDIYDPIRDEVKSRDVHDINYWMLDDDYDGSNFVVRQVFFCGGDKDEFDQWKKELNNLAAAKTKKAAEQTLKLEIDDEAFAHAYGHTSRAFPIKKGQKVAVRVVSQYGEETTKVMEAK